MSLVYPDFFKQSGHAFAAVANKIDKLRKSELEPNLARIRETLDLSEEIPLIPFSADRGDGRDALLNEILFML